MNPPPTLRSIAKAAGVSLSTVSYALRDSPRLSLSTRERIQRLAEELGYRPNPLVTSLMAHVRLTKPVSAGQVIAFINPFGQELDKSAYFRRFVHGAAQRADELGYQLEEFWLHHPEMTSRRLTEILYNRGIQAIVIGPLVQPKGHLSMDFSRFASAAIGYSMLRPNLHRAANHHSHTIRQAYRELVHRRYKRIGLVLEAAVNDRVDQNWLAGYLVEQYSRPGSHRVEPLLGKPLTKELVLSWVREHKPEVIIAGNSEVYNWIESSGMKIPDDMGLVHLDWLPGMDNWAGMDQRSEAVGAAALDMLLGQLHRNERGIPFQPKVTLTAGRWVDGPSVKPGNSFSGKGSPRIESAHNGKLT